MTAVTAGEVFLKVVPSIRSGDIDALLASCADDVVFEFPFAPASRPREIVGKRQVHEYLSAIPSRVTIDRMSNLEIHQTVRPEVAVVEMTTTGTVKETGASHEMSYVVVVTVRNGTITRYQDYWNRLALQGTSST